MVSTVVHVSCQSSEFLRYLAPLGTDRMDPGLILYPVWDRLRNLCEAGAVTLASCGTKVDALTYLWIPEQLESRMKRRMKEV